MRKGLFALGVIVLLGVGYLGAQVASSLLFERELARTLADLDARDDLAVERRNAQQGWFASSGEIVVTEQVEGDWAIELPYTARHGVLATRAEGDLLPIDDQGEPLFGEALPIPAPRWHAEYRTLSDDAEVRVELSPFSASEGGRDIVFQGGRILLEGERDDLRLRARLGPFDVEQGDNALRLDPLSLDTRYRGADENNSARWNLDALRVTSPTLGIRVDVSGELRFLGEDWGAFRLTDLQAEHGRREWLSRLEGRFTWPEPPTLVLLQLGLPLNTERLEIDIADGEIVVNGRPLAMLY